MIKKEKIDLVKKQVVFVGIDIASKRHCARFLDNLGKEQIPPVSFSNDLEGVKKLETHFNQIPNLDHNIIFGVEPSGDYWKPLAYFLRGKRYPVVLVNPYHLKRTKEIIDNSQDKTDDKDSYLVGVLPM